MSFFKKLFSIFKKKKDEKLDKDEQVDDQIEELKKEPEPE